MFKFGFVWFKEIPISKLTVNFIKALPNQNVTFLSFSFSFLLSTMTQYLGRDGYTRMIWGEPLQRRPFGYWFSTYFSPTYYSCELEIPQEVIDQDPETLLTNQPDRYIYAETGQLEQRNPVILTIPVYMESKRISMSNSNALNNTNISIESLYNEAMNSSMFNEFVDNLRTLTEIVKDVKQLVFDYWCLNFRYFSIYSWMRWI